MSYPGLASDAKAYIWNTMCRPVLLYGSDCIDICAPNMRKLETLQGNLLKQSLGLSKRSRSTHLLEALGVHKLNSTVIKNTVTFFSRIFKIDSPLQNLCNSFMSLYISSGIVVPGTLVGRILSWGLSPLNCAFNGNAMKRVRSVESGVTDSLRNLIMHEHFIKPYSEQHLLTSLLTRSF